MRRRKEGCDGNSVSHSSEGRLGCADVGRGRELEDGSAYTIGGAVLVGFHEGSSREI